MKVILVLFSAIFWLGLDVPVAKAQIVKCYPTCSSDPGGDPYSPSGGDGNSPWDPAARDPFDQGAGGELPNSSGVPTIDNSFGQVWDETFRPIKDFIRNNFSQNDKKKERRRYKESLIRDLDNKFERYNTIDKTVSEALNGLDTTQDLIAQSELSEEELANRLGSHAFTDLNESELAQFDTEPADLPALLTSENSAKGLAVRQAYQTLERRQALSEEMQNDYYDTYHGAAKEALKLADERYALGQNETADQLMDFALSVSESGINSNPLTGTGRDYYWTLHGTDAFGNSLSDQAKFAALWGVSGNLALKESFQRVGGEVMRQAPNLRVIQGGMAQVESGLIRLGLSRISALGVRALAFISTRIIPVLIALDPTTTGHSADRYPINGPLFNPNDIDDPRIALPSPSIYDDASTWADYLTGSGKFSGQQGVVDADDYDLAKAVSEAGIRDPREAENLVSSARKLGLSKAGDVKNMTRWNKGNATTLEDSLKYHHQKHGDSRTMSEYLSDAAKFDKSKATRNPTSGTRADGSVKYTNDKEFLIERDGQIVTYGPK